MVKNGNVQSDFWTTLDEDSFRTETLVTILSNMNVLLVKRNNGRLSGVNFFFKIKSGSEDPTPCARVRPPTFSPRTLFESLRWSFFFFFFDAKVTWQ